MTCVQQLMELQELYNSQQFLTAELSDKLEKTEVNMVVHYVLDFYVQELD